MKEKDKIKRNTKVKLIIILIVAITAIMSIVFAYAKYKTTLQGETSNQIAKWSFKVVDGNQQTIDVLDFPVTRTDNNSDVQQGNIAPRYLWKI